MTFDLKSWDINILILLLNDNSNIVSLLKKFFLMSFLIRGKECSNL
jgi:hypothetical protein